MCLLRLGPLRVTRGIVPSHRAFVCSWNLLCVNCGDVPERNARNSWGWAFPPCFLACEDSVLSWSCGRACPPCVYTWKRAYLQYIAFVLGNDSDRSLGRLFCCTYRSSVVAALVVPFELHFISRGRPSPRTRPCPRYNIMCIDNPIVG